MFRNFHKVYDDLYRGGKISPEDVKLLKEEFDVDQIISLDEKIGNDIGEACKKLNIKHIIIPLNANDKKSIKYVLKYDWESLLENHTTYIHCLRGKDRTGIIISLIKMIRGCSPLSAIKEAKEYGYGTGLDIPVELFWTKVICKFAAKFSKSDVNEAIDVVDNVNEISHYFDSTQDNLSWSPFEDYRVLKYPFSEVNRYYNYQYPDRESYNLEPIDTNDKKKSFPQVGTYDQNVQGISGAGPSLVGGGYIL